MLEFPIQVGDEVVTNCDRFGNEKRGRTGEDLLEQIHRPRALEVLYPTVICGKDR